MDGPEDELALLRRRLAFQVSRRSMLDVEELFKRFFDLELDQLDASGLQDLEIILRYPDNDLLDWLSGVAEPPADVNRKMLGRLRKRRSGVA